MGAWKVEFVTEEMKNLQIILEEWKDMYLFSNFHEVYLAKFLVLLFEWLERNTLIRVIRIPKGPIIWTKYRLNQLENVKNHWSRAEYFRYTSIVEGYIMEFVVEGLMSFNKAERMFSRGPCGRYINFVPMWIKMLLCEKGVMSMENDTMVN